MSIVGCDELPESGYLRAKVAQEKLIEDAAIPYSIIRATQFAEFVEAITASLVVGEEVRVPDALIQPIATQDLADEVARVAEGTPLAGIENIGGRGRSRSSRWLERSWPGRAMAKTVVVDPHTCYFGTPLSTNSLVIS